MNAQAEQPAILRHYSKGVAIETKKTAQSEEATRLLNVEKQTNAIQMRRCVAS